MFVNLWRQRQQQQVLNDDNEFNDDSDDYSDALIFKTTKLLTSLFKIQKAF